MAHEKTWQYALNIILGDVSSGTNQANWFLWKLKEALIGNVPLTDQSGAAIGSPTGLWTVRGSSDGVTAGLDGVDRWGATFDTTKLVHATAGSAHSWMCLTSAALGVDLILDCASSSAGTVMHSVCYATPTGGSTTARPTCTDEVTGNSVGNAFIETTTSGVGRHVHFVLATDGSVFAYNSKDGSGLVQGLFALQEMVDLVAGDAYPLVAVVDYAASGALRSGSFTAYFRPSSGAATNGAPVAPFINNSSILLGAGAAPPNQNGKLTRFETKLADVTSWRIKGRCQDWFLTPKSALDTDVVPSTGAPTDAHIGCCLIPVNAALSL